MANPPTYRSALLTGRGDLSKLIVADLPLREPARGEIRVKVTASGAGATDLIMRTGRYIYAPRKFPFTPGYELVGIVESVGRDVEEGFSVGDPVAALVVHGGMAEYAVRDAKHFVKIEPKSFPHDIVVALMLNYVTAYQMIVRVAKMKEGQTALVTGANGGVGTALLELLRWKGVKAYGMCRAQHFDAIKALGGIPLARLEGEKAEPIDVTVRRVESAGVDVVFDVLGGPKARECVRALKPGGLIVGYGFVATFVNKKSSVVQALKGFYQYFVGARLAGRRGTFYGITAEYRKHPELYKEDLRTLIGMCDDGSAAALRPVVAARLPLLAARTSQEMLEKGGLVGKIVMLREVGLE